MMTLITVTLISGNAGLLRLKQIFAGLVIALMAAVRIMTAAAAAKEAPNVTNVIY